MFFEGSEKKLEIHVNHGINLLTLPHSVWHELVSIAGAQILSKISGPNATAFLLSESSLFVWQDRLILITCGQTTLADSLVFFMQQLGDSHIELVMYERKNEYFPHLQKSDFYSDVKKINSIIQGQAWRFGDVGDHHLFLFHSQKSFSPPAHDNTIEILMYRPQGFAKDLFNRKNLTKQEVQDAIGINKIFRDFQIDDYVFEPCGYSINGINGKEYFTIHVTPQEYSSYVSFETNITRQQEALNWCLEIFRPEQLDVVQISSVTSNASVQCQSPLYKKTTVAASLECGYEVDYSHWFMPTTSPKKPWKVLPS